MDHFFGRLGLQQRVLPAYRSPFFEALAGVCPQGLSVFAGEPRPSEAIENATGLRQARLVRARNLNLFSGSLWLVWQSGLLSWLKDWDPSALIMETNPRALRNPAAARWMHSRHRPLVGWGLGFPKPTGPLSTLMKPSQKDILKRFDTIIAYSQQGAEEYRQSGFPAERIFVAPNAVTPRPTQPPPPRPSEFSGRPTLLFVGRLQKRKRLDYLMQACAALPAELQPRLLIVGEGPAGVDYQKLAGEIYPQAEFLGALHGEELTPLYAAADLFVLPGTGGLAVQQAMAHGLPVVVAEADGTQADLVRPQNGWCVPPGDPEMLTSVLRESLRDPQRLRHMGAASYDIVAKEVNLEVMVTVFLKALDMATTVRGRK